jgi:hypothetical protein
MVRTLIVKKGIMVVTQLVQVGEKCPIRREGVEEMEE